MDAVHLIERRVTGHPVEEERNQRHIVLAGEVTVDLPECRRVFGTVVGRRFHPGQDHQGAPLLPAFDDRRQVSAEVSDRQSAQRIVAAQRHEQDGRVRLHHPRQATQAAG